MKNAKQNKPKPESADESLAERVLRALKLARLDAIRVARLHNTPIYFIEKGKIVARKPWLKRKKRSAKRTPKKRS